MCKFGKLIEPDDDLRSLFPDRNFRNRRSFVTGGERILVIDPCYVADVFESSDDVSIFLQENGVFLMDFGGDTTTPIWWSPPDLVLPIAIDERDLELVRPKDSEVLAELVGCDSGSFMFLPLSDQRPHGLRKSANMAIEEGDGAALSLPRGLWTAYYQQFDAPTELERSFCRNIVLKHSNV